jgi:hypothetical protein
MKLRTLALALAAATGAAQAGPPPPKPSGDLYLGADLSYVNEMEDCGAIYRKGGQPVDPFALLKAEGGNIVRVRIWNNATWTKYSNYADVLKTIRRAHGGDKSCSTSIIPTTGPTAASRSPRGLGRPQLRPAAGRCTAIPRHLDAT